MGPRQASLTQTWATGLGRRFRTFGAGSYLDAVRGGKVTERVDPNGRESVARLPLAAGNTEDFKTSSEVPNPEAIPADWTEIVYAGF